MFFLNLPSLRPKVLIIITSVLILIGLGFWIFVFKPSFLFPQPSVPKETPFVYHLPHGRQEYSAQYGPNAKGPKIVKAIIDPLDVAEGQKQTVTLQLKNDSPITLATAILITDHKHMDGTFHFVSGTPTNGTWQLSWTLEDTNNSIYQIYITLGSSTGTWEGALTFL